MVAFTNTVRMKSLNAIVSIFSRLLICGLGIAGTTTALAAGDLLSPATAFFQPPLLSGAALSPNGRLVALRVGAKGSRDRLAVLTLDTMKLESVASFADADVDDFRWVNDSRLVFNLGDRRLAPEARTSGPGLYSVNADGSAFRQLVALQRPPERDATGTRQLAQRERVWAPDNTGTNQMVERERLSGRDSIASNELPFGTLLLPQPATQEGPFVHVLQPEASAGNGGGDGDGNRAGPYRLLQLNAQNGRSIEIDAPAAAVDWLVDASGTLRGVQTAQGALATLHWRDSATAPWRVLRRFDMRSDENLALKALGPDGKLIVSARVKRDTEALYVLDPATNTLSAQPLLANPQYDIKPTFVYGDNRLLGIRWLADAEVTHWLDEAMKSRQAEIDKLLPNTANSVTPARIGTSPWLLVRAFADVQPTVHYAYHMPTQKLTRLGAEQPALKGMPSTTDMVRFKARDGLEIPAYLTLPASAVSKKNLPLVVLVHAGPWQRGAQWQWQPALQFLAARGYAVLQPEFRGSTGFGQRHFKAGFKQWGLAMQDDLADAARWAIAQGFADSSRICIVGAGYGGYAALMGLARDGAVFRCGVSASGVSDLAQVLGPPWADAAEDPQRFGLPALIGGREQDAAALAAASPIRQAARISNPVLIGHGALDKRLPVADSRRLVDAIRAHNPNVEWVAYDNEGHGWTLPETQADWWTRVADFLARHIPPAK